MKCSELVSYSSGELQGRARVSFHDYWHKSAHLTFVRLNSKMVLQPVLFIAGTRDAVLKPEMSRGMEAFIPKLIRKEVPSGHWALTQTPAEVNGFIKEWFEEVVFGAKSTL